VARLSREAADTRGEEASKRQGLEAVIARLEGQVRFVALMYLSVFCFKSNDQHPTVNPPFKPPNGAQLKRA